MVSNRHWIIKEIEHRSTSPYVMHGISLIEIQTVFLDYQSRKGNSIKFEIFTFLLAYPPHLPISFSLHERKYFRLSFFSLSAALGANPFR